MAISEIEKLERRYSENPHGYTFAPLAEAYRKSADLPRALDVLKRGLELHPDYVPASIVLGRVHLDRRDDGAAELAFSHVLTLDPENVIALKAMADITEGANRPADAARWLELLLAVDRSNDEARQQLDRLAASRPSWPQAAVTSAPTEEHSDGSVGTLEQAFEAATGPTGSTAVGAGEIAPDERPSAPAQPEEHLEGVLPAAPFSSGPPAVDNSSLTLEPSPMPGLEVSERTTSTPEPSESSAPVEGFESPLAAYADEGLASAPDSNAPDLVFDRPSHTEYQLPDMSRDFGMDLRSSGANEFQLPSASDEFSSFKPGTSHNEYQLPDASGDFAVTGGADKTSTPAPAPALGAPVGKPSEPAVPGRAPGSAADSAARDDVPPTPSAAAPEASAEPAASPSEPPAPPTPIEPLSAPAWQGGSWSQPEPVNQASSAVPEDKPPEPGQPETPAPFSWTPATPPTRKPEPAAPRKPWYETAFETSEPEQATPAEPMASEPSAEAEAVEPASVESDHADTPEAAEPPFAPEPELIVTESMAELFLQQGHRVEALRVYRQLVQRRPGDERLVAKVIELESAEETIAPVSPANASPGFAAETSGGTSVRELLRAILGSRPVSGEVAEAAAEQAASKAEDSSGAPTRPAPDHLSLSAIFGDDAPATPPAVRPAKPAATRGTGMSFDEFYDSGTEESSGSEPNAKSQRSIRGGDDLDQFHTWLQNLKR